MSIDWRKTVEAMKDEPIRPDRLVVSPKVAEALTVCPRCGNSPDGTPPDICSPVRCDAWIVTHHFNHDTREWDEARDD